jgi:tRNA (guanine6-N2)-methyltransferase
VGTCLFDGKVALSHHRRTKPKAITIECDVPSGIEDVAAAEIRERLPSAMRIGTVLGRVVFELPRGDVARVPALRVAEGAWIVVGSDSRRPANLATPLVEAINRVRRVHPPGRIRAVDISAPGVHATSLDELRRSIASGTGVPLRRGGLVVRVRRRVRGEGWDGLVAVAPQSLAQREWRVASLQGSMNAALAAAMVRLTEPGAEDRFLNVGCGSGTIVIERSLVTGAARLAAADVSPAAISAAAANATAAGVRARIDFATADMCCLPYTARSFDVVCSDLPWGHRVGSHAANAQDYQAWLVEIARVARRRARAVVLTNELRLMQRSLGALAALWRLDRLSRVEQGGARPGLFILRRS